MLTVRICLEPCSPTSRPQGLYDTFVAVTAAEFARGEHLRIACKRAMTLGYGGPHRVSQVRVVTPLLARLAGLGADEQEMSDPSPLRERLDAVIEAAHQHAGAAEAPLEAPRGRPGARQSV